MMTRTGFEPVLPPWKGGVLTTWPTGHDIKINSGRRTRTVDSLINSQVLYQLSYAGITRGNFLSSQGAIP